MRKLYLFLYISFFSFISVNAQIINGYAEVTAILPGNVLNVSTQNEAAGATATFTAGMEILVMQMQDSVLGNSTNTSGFGSVGSIRSAGLFEYAVIASVSRTAGTLNSVTLTAPLVKTFRVGTNAKLQIITFPTLGSPHFVTTTNITALPWDGNIGGVINFKVNGNLTLGHLIDARGAGFRGGLVSPNNGSSCENNVFISAPSTKYASKGEGIFKNTNVNLIIAKGKIINGGGGGIVHNGGGGGGGNFSAGGDGGAGFNTGGCTGSSGGLGGISLSPFITPQRIFMGGGGGGGQQNNSRGTPGGRGGGIIFIKADTIKSGVGCGVLIDASGIAGANTILPTGNDGAGGGGAGGSVYLDALDFNIDVSCPLSIKGDGGNGGNASVTGTPHGGGGGGGQGLIIFARARPTTNVISTVLNGTAGTDNTAGSTTSSPGGGVSNTGIFQNQGALPVELIYFVAEKQKDRVALSWATATEKNNKKFIVYKSENLLNWEVLEEVNGQTNSSIQTDYKIHDYTPYRGITYYLLEQEDLDGKKEKFTVQAVEFDKSFGPKPRAYPNPSNGNDEILIENINKAESSKLTVRNMIGQVLNSQIIDKGNGLFGLNIKDFKAGIYIIDFNSKQIAPIKFIVSK
jgi:hypothetical protein